VEWAHIEVSGSGDTTAVITTDREGRYAFTDISPDIYQIQAEAGNWHSGEKMIVLLSDKEEEVELSLTEEGPVAGRRVEVILDKIRIMSDMDPCIMDKGELVFTSVVIPDSDISKKQVKRLPVTGVYHVSDRPGKNEITPGATLFDGIVKNRSLSISIAGRELDVISPDDELTRYHRLFSGDPRSWRGEYHPFDEYLDQEYVGEWAVWYRIIIS